MLGNLVTNGNALNAYLYLRGVGAEPLNGREALAQLALALPAHVVDPA